MKIVSYLLLFSFILLSCNDQDVNLNDSDVLLVVDDHNLQIPTRVNKEDWEEIEIEEASLDSINGVIGKRITQWGWFDEGSFKTFSTNITSHNSTITDIYISEAEDIYISGLICDGNDTDACSFISILKKNGERLDYYLKNHSQNSFSSKVFLKNEKIYILLNYSEENREEFSECIENEVLLLSVGKGLEGSETIIKPKFNNCHKCWDMADFEGYLALLCLTNGEKLNKTTDVVLLDSHTSYSIDKNLQENDLPFHIVKNKSSLSLYSNLDDGGYNEYIVSVQNEELTINKKTIKPAQPMLIRRIVHDEETKIFCGQDYLEIRSKPDPFGNIVSSTSFGSVSKYDKDSKQFENIRVITKDPPDNKSVYGPWTSSVAFAFEEKGIVYYVGHSTFDTENKGRTWDTNYQTDLPVRSDMLYSAFIFAEKNEKIYVKQLISNIVPVYPFMIKKKYDDLYIAGVNFDGDYNQGIFIHKVNESFLFDGNPIAHYSIFAICENGQIEPGELCDGPSPCSMISDSYSSGIAKCIKCSKWDTKDCVLK